MKYIEKNSWIFNALKNEKAELKLKD